MKKFPRQLIYLLLLTAALWLVHLTLIERFRILNQVFVETVLRAGSHATSPMPTPPVPQNQPSPPVSVPTPTPAAKPIDTMGWVAHQNTNFGFGFRYPKDHTVFVDINRETNTLVPADTRGNYMAIVEDESKIFCDPAMPGTSCEPVALSFEVANFDQPFDWWLGNNLERVIPKQNMVSQKNITFAGKPAVEVVGQEGAGPPAGGVYKLILVKPGNFFVIILQNSPSTLLDAVLGTFTFNPGNLQ